MPQPHNSFYKHLTRIFMSSDLLATGSLSQYFTGVAWKRLSEVEASPTRSNQHEFNGVNPIKKILGERKIDKISTRFIYLADDSTQSQSCDGYLTWYDSREKHPVRSEYRLYYNGGNEVAGRFAAGSMVVFAFRSSTECVVICADEGSTAESQVAQLFGISTEEAGRNTNAVDIESGRESDRTLSLTSVYLLEELGISYTPPDPSDRLLDIILSRFKGFPTIREFSSFSRELYTQDVSPLENPDTLLTGWMTLEEKMFRLLERHVIMHRLESGFEQSERGVEEFISFSLSVQNRRKARAGGALEDHLSEVFRLNGLFHSRTPVTEHKSRPDFIFPSIEIYRKEDADPSLLTMLGAKTTCKDRWRQVLSEAARVTHKHLFTLESSISRAQTDEMQASGLQLVVPQDIFPTYSAGQQTWLMNLKDFLSLVRDRQERSAIYA